MTAADRKQLEGSVIVLRCLLRSYTPEGGFSVDRQQVQNAILDVERVLRLPSFRCPPYHKAPLGRRP